MGGFLIVERVFMTRFLDFECENYTKKPKILFPIKFDHTKIISNATNKNLISFKSQHNKNFLLFKFSIEREVRKINFWMDFSTHTHAHVVKAFVDILTLYGEFHALYWLSLVISITLACNDFCYGDFCVFFWKFLKFSSKVF